MAEITITDQNRSLANELLAANPLEGVNVWWLGQAGFVIRSGKINMLIDPYLSDSLAEKYKSAEFPHIRMMDPPLFPNKARHINYILCTHGHTDHMDAKTILPILGNNPNCKCLVPRAWEKHGMDFGVKAEDLITISSDEVVMLKDKITVRAFPSAHESLEEDADGNHLYLGYIIKIGPISIYHSGDCIPYPELLKNIQKFKIDVALLPVNGRDEFRRSRGVPGNFTFEEASKLCLDANIKHLIPHHFGMFDFNTISQNELEDKVTQVPTKELKITIPEIDKKYQINIIN